MILSKYPYVVQKEILDHMGYNDLFLLSFASKNMKKFIKSSQMSRFQSCSFIKYTCDYRDEPWICVHYGKIRQGIMRIVKREEDKNDYFQLNVSGKTIDFRFKRVDQNIRFPAIENSYYMYPFAAYQETEKESVIK
ncbi:hypothetical protein B9Z55_000678 [Caenorhabditis nigoni]|uniref:F-box domain-containing protein n=1 Tax=Caenorhabditis nigoni TaxID=1611254 RepID=A0A2G5VUB2_9PELO|nr:hypothetical protein B9Z55_000678 [Caenorhabditis nigoni]